MFPHERHVAKWYEDKAAIIRLKSLLNSWQQKSKKKGKPFWYNLVSYIPWDPIKEKGNLKLFILWNKDHEFLAYRNSWTLDASVGRWALDAGLWMLDCGCWTLDAGLWTLDSGRWTLDAGRWTLDAGRWTLDAGCYTLNAGLWALDTIVDCFKAKSETSFWVCLIKLLKILWVWISKDLMVTLVL